MNSDKNILVKLNNAGFKQNNKWLVEGVSLKLKRVKL
jgi:zinc transport system ATP-binding protein